MIPGSQHIYWASQKGHIKAALDKYGLEQTPVMDAVPNPFNESLKIVLQNPNEVLIRIQIFNITGSLQKDTAFDQLVNPLEINVEDLKPGVYVLHAETPNRVYSARIMKK